MFTVSKLRNSAFLFAACVAATVLVFAQSELDLYTTAVRQSRISDRMAWMERFLAQHPDSHLREDALEVLVWDSLEGGQREQARQRAQELRQIDPNNALAMAVVAETRAETTGRTDKKAAAQAFEIAKVGIQMYPQLHRPEGMREGEFISLQRQVVAVLDGEAGLGYLAEKDYEAARRYLHESVAIRPQDPRYLYGLALALLDGKDPMQQEGYVYLARTVDLTQGTPAGPQIANYAQKRFEKQGGTATGWNEYLAAARVPGAPNHVPAQPATQPEPPVMAKNTPPPSPRVQPQSEPRETSPEEIPQPTFKREFVSRTSPISMGILIQTEHMTKENRRQILDALTDMIRHLRNDDEVFIMAYGKNLEFEQDLTGNPKLLEEAMEQIKPETGTALLDAVGFAAGHLERIATNKNRLLLVISDGRNTPSKDNPLTLSQKLNTVRVDCIGLDVDGESGRRQLQSLAAYSGGQVSFANDTRQLRTAAVQMAEAIGIEFPD